MKIIDSSHLFSISLIYLLIYFVHGIPTDNSKLNCINVKNLFINEGLYVNEKAGTSSGNPRVCRRERTCCNRSTELKLNIKSKSEFQQKFRQLINNNIETVLINWAEQFNSYYINAIQQGHREFDLMFQKLYGPRYKDNYEIFNELFKNLQLYHEKGDLKLELTLNEFFEKLFVRLFRMLNPSFQFKSEYENCIVESFSLVEPFGDIPKNLLNDLKRQLGASRTFVQGLLAGANVIKHLNQIDISNSCGVELMQINYCSICQAHLNLKPCKSSCELAYSKCVINYQDFESEWNNYLSTVLQFGRRLENTLSLENMLGSINYRISDVIMFFQENKVSITDKVFEKCNVKKLSRRSTPDDGDETLNNQFKETHSKNQEISKTWKKLASDVKKKIKSLKSYWSKLPKGICKNSNPVEKCWNSTHSIELNMQVVNMKPSFMDIKINKNTNVFRLIDLQRNALQVINSKLISSYNGNGLEKFEFDTQASNIGKISTEFNEENDYGLDDDDDETDYEQRKEDDEPQSLDEQIDKLTEESKDSNKLRSEASQDDEFSPNESENVRKQENNNLGNDINNLYSNVDTPRDAGLNSRSYLISISICTLIISQLTSLLMAHLGFH